MSAVLQLVANPTARRRAALVSLCVGIIVQLGLVVLSMYLIDLAISLCELWAALAEQHLRITL